MKILKLKSIMWIRNLLGENSDSMNTSAKYSALKFELSVSYIVYDKGCFSASQWYPYVIIIIGKRKQATFDYYTFAHDNVWKLLLYSLKICKLQCYSEIC